MTLRRKKPAPTLQRNNAAPNKANVDNWWQTRASTLIPPPTQHTGKAHNYFQSPNAMWQGACEYFEWIESRPIYESRPFQYKGSVQLHKIPRRRPFTLRGLLVFFDMSNHVWQGYRDRRGPQYAYVVERIEHVIHTQKFEGAVADLFNANIITRDLGLRDTQELTGPNGGPLRTVHAIAKQADLSALTDAELDAVLTAIDQLDETIDEGGAV